MKLRSRLYSSSRTKPMQVAVPTRCVFPAAQVGPRFPFAESVLAEATVQPYVHDCVVKVIEAGRTYRFRVFFKRHCRLRTNRSFPAKPRNVFHGDILVMRAAALHYSSVVNMRERDTILSDYLVYRWGPYQWFATMPDLFSKDSHELLAKWRADASQHHLLTENCPFNPLEGGMFDGINYGELWWRIRIIISTWLSSRANRIWYFR